MNQIVIISCGKRKNPVFSCDAKNAYLGASFKIKRKYAELTKKPWYILSAKYGLLRPETPIKPNYDQTVSTKKDIIQLANLVSNQLDSFPEFQNCEEIQFLGPTSYSKVLTTVFSGRYSIKINHLTEGLSQGKTMKKIKDMTENLRIDRTMKE